MKRQQLVVLQIDRLSPQNLVWFHIDQLGGDPKIIAIFYEAAREQRINAQIGRNFPGIDDLIAIIVDGGRGANRKRVDISKFGNDLIRQGESKEIRLRILFEISEWENCQAAWAGPCR